MYVKPGAVIFAFCIMAFFRRKKSGVYVVVFTLGFLLLLLARRNYKKIEQPTIKTTNTEVENSLKSQADNSEQSGDILKFPRYEPGQDDVTQFLSVDLSVFQETSITNRAGKIKFDKYLKRVKSPCFDDGYLDDFLAPLLGIKPPDVTKENHHLKYEQQPPLLSSFAE